MARNNTSMDVMCGRIRSAFILNITKSTSAQGRRALYDRVVKTKGLDPEGSPAERPRTKNSSACKKKCIFWWWWKINVSRWEAVVVGCFFFVLLIIRKMNKMMWRLNKSWDQKRTQFLPRKEEERGLAGWRESRALGWTMCGPRTVLWWGSAVGLCSWSMPKSLTSPCLCVLWP